MFIALLVGIVIVIAYVLVQEQRGGPFSHRDERRADGSGGIGVSDAGCADGGGDGGGGGGGDGG